MISRFLRFRIPNNNCFDQKAVQEFQRKLLSQELVKARKQEREIQNVVESKRKTVKSVIPERLLPSVSLFVRNAMQDCRKLQKEKHNKKLLSLSDEQERPLFNVKNTVVVHGLDRNPPSYVLETLSLGPKTSVLDRFEPKDVLSELDGLLNFCKTNNVSNETITDINVKTLNYIKKCKKMKSSRNIMMTKKYLKENKLVAVPFDKGVGICIMKQETYKSKLDDILQLPQFEKLRKERKNALDPTLKEEERIDEALKRLLNEEKIDKNLYQKLKPKGSQPARLYGLAKVHKTSVPTRPVLSMPGSVYHKIGMQIGEWLSVVPECQINTSSKQIADILKETHLDSDEELVSFDVTSLYTNVPVMEAINTCADLLYDGNHERPPVDRGTFVLLTQLSSCNVVMSTLDGYYKQVDGLAMGSPPASYLANGWLYKYDANIRGEAKLHARYMDDIIMSIKRDCIEAKLLAINNLHQSLKFTIEREINGEIPFLDMMLMNEEGKLSSRWYNKPTDTGLILNYHALAPRRYKKSVVAGFVYRIHRCCSTWKWFHASIEKAKVILEINQYPPTFYEPIIRESLEKIVSDNVDQQVDRPISTDQSVATGKHMIFVQYRGKVTEDYARALHKLNTPCTVVMTMRKLKTILPSLKPAVEKRIRSRVVYTFQCPCCEACYVGATTRHICTRLREHLKPSAVVGKHLKACGARKITIEEVEILATSMKSENHLFTLEALFIRERNPTINTKDEWKRKELTIKF